MNVVTQRESGLTALCSADCRVSSGSEIQTQDLRFQGEDDTTTQKGLTRKCGRITSVTTAIHKAASLTVPGCSVIWERLVTKELGAL